MMVIVIDEGESYYNLARQYYLLKEAGIVRK